MLGVPFSGPAHPVSRSAHPVSGPAHPGVRRRFVAVVAMVLAGSLVLGLAPVRAHADADDGFGRRRQLLGLTNEARERRDRRELGFAAALSRYAREHSEAMARRGHLFHSSEDALRAALDGYAWSLAGENVGVGSSLQSLQDAFMASALHRENILRPTYGRAAIGVVRAHGRIWVTVIFYG
jgi:Cysteine-rich secretory protein family